MNALKEEYEALYLKVEKEQIHEKDKLEIKSSTLNKLAKEIKIQIFYRIYLETLDKSNLDLTNKEKDLLFNNIIRGYISTWEDMLNK